MTSRPQKSLCRRIAGSLALVTALLVALTCGVGYWLMARTLLTERGQVLASEVNRQAAALEDAVARQTAWLETLAGDLGGIAPEPESVQALLAERRRANGNLINIRAVIDGVLYSGEEPVGAEAVLWEDWYVQSGPSLTCFPPRRDGGRQMMTISLPIPLDAGENGVLAADFPLDDLLLNLSRFTLFDGGFPLLLDQEGNTMAAGPEAPAGLAGPPVGLREGCAVSLAGNDGKKRIYVGASVNPLGWKLLYAIDRYTMLKPLEPVLWMSLTACAVSAGLAALLALWRMDALSDPLRELTRAAEEMKKGRYKLKARYQEDDEFGALFRALESGCDWTARRIDELSHAMGRMAQGDFTVKADEHYTGDFASVGESIDRIAGALHNVFKQVNLTAKWALGGSHQVSGVSGRLSAGIESQSNSVEALGKAATLMRHESNQNALNASRAQEAALSVGTDLRESARQTALLGGCLQETEDAIRSLAGLLDMAKKSVSQGRMLSISVSAEAERAGEQAAEFAMAVEELRALFTAAQKSIGEAGDRLDEALASVSRTDDGVKRAARAIHSVTKKNSQAAEYLNRIASASQLQAQAAAKMSKEVAVISVVIQTNAQLAEQFDYSTNAFSDQAKTLSEMAAAFYTKGDAKDDEKSAPIIFDEGSGGFSVTEEK